MMKASLSLCMIVKNEAASLKRCLESAAPYVDEMIIVDTGSTDGTLDVARMFTTSVISCPWNGSFSEARNQGVALATGDWILWLDADEVLECDQDPRLLKELTGGHELLLSVRTIHYTGKEANPAEAYQLAQTRLFRNHSGFKFIYSIHEMLNAEEIMERSGRLILPPIVPVSIHHYGYMDNARKNKAGRNLRMLEQAYASEEKHPWLEYHLANEYYYNGEYDQAVKQVNQSIVRFLLRGQIPPSMLYQLKYASVLALGNEQEFRASIDKAILLYPDYVDLHFYKGVILYRNGDFEEALATFKHCLTLGDDNLNHLTEYGLGSVQAMQYIRLCKEKLNEL
ncbi:glycosyltransferase family 2 protein [Paenibacillus sp. HW567]|uniref:glycosyltransferase family 2 protein n=1 Tax=Paenibacillus sp. HW567 TaxID=1034769 RepID=UPI00036B0946|nr:glycosyltransferase family 2 protein [Paenibacillus sp. HW567]